MDPYIEALKSFKNEKVHPLIVVFNRNLYWENLPKTNKISEANKEIAKNAKNIEDQGLFIEAVKKGIKIYLWKLFWF